MAREDRDIWREEDGDEQKKQKTETPNAVMEDSDSDADDMREDD